MLLRGRIQDRRTGSPGNEGSRASATRFDSAVNEVERRAVQTIHMPTLVGLILLLVPLLTAAHEIGGHAALCLATGSELRTVGAHYVQCQSADIASQRIVSLAGTAVDVAIAAAAYLLMRRGARGLWGVALWMVFAYKGLLAAGYPIYSGVSGNGDWGPSGTGGLAPLVRPELWRICFLLLGLCAYVAVVRLAIVCVRRLVGGGVEAGRSQRVLSMTLYMVAGIVAVASSLLSPVGTLTAIISAAGASFGALAGLISVAARSDRTGAPLPLVIAPNWLLVLAGAAMSVAFALVLGLSIQLR